MTGVVPDGGGGERGFDKDALAVVLSADTNMRF